MSEYHANIREARNTYQRVIDALAQDEFATALGFIEDLRRITRSVSGDDDEYQQLLHSAICAYCDARDDRRNDQ